MKKLNYLFVSDQGLIGDLAWAVKKEGHNTKYYIRGKNEKDICDGFIEKTENWEEDVDWADTIVFDDIGFGKKADSLRKSGKSVIGGSEYTDKLEEGRGYGQSELKEAGVSIIEAWNFTDFDSAIKFIKKNPSRYVIKPSGNAHTEKELLFVGEEEDGRDIAEMLERYKHEWSTKIKEFQLQKHVDGVEVAVGAFFNGNDFVGPINVNFEHKRLFPGGLGPETGEMGTTIFFTKESKIFDATLLKMKEKLKASGYVGYIDVNCMANQHGIYPLEFTCRFGYPHISILMEGVIGNWGEFLLQIAQKKCPSLRTKNSYLIGFVVAVPPFPFEDFKSFQKYSQDASVIFKNGKRDGVHLGDVKLVNGDWHLAGSYGYALVVTAAGMNMENARQTALKRIKNITIPNMFYRTDIGKTWDDDNEKLRKWGYL